MRIVLRMKNYENLVLAAEIPCANASLRQYSLAIANTIWCTQVRTCRWVCVRAGMGAGGCGCAWRGWVGHACVRASVRQLLDLFQKNPRAHKNKIGTPPPPPKTQNTPPPLKRGILWTWVFLQKERMFPGVHKIHAPISGPRIADKNFTDTRIFLTLNGPSY